MTPLSVALVHYHLDPGGVSQVIATTSREFARRGIRHVILTGRTPHADFVDLPARAIDGLDYDASAHPDSLAGACERAAAEALGGPPSLWHFHNPSLGKNPSLPEVIRLLARKGHRLLLQIHDLAESGRPANYARIPDPGMLYPLAPAVHYAFLNSSDRERFRHAGLPADQAWELPNPVSLLPLPPAPNASWVLYPARGIRRKNLGELLLMAILSPPGTRFAVTRAPSNPAWKPIHDAWLAFAETSNLPVAFDVVDRQAPSAEDDASFASWLKHASHFVTTSVEEGFGLVFIEAAASGRPLIGRALPKVTANLPFPDQALYQRLLIPADGVDPGRLRALLDEQLRTTRGRYGRSTRESDVDKAYAALHREGFFDFGNLPEEIQRRILDRLLAEPAFRNRILVETRSRRLPMTAWLSERLSTRESDLPAETLEGYTPARHADRLLAIYPIIASAPSGDEIRFLPAPRILEGCLAPEAFHFLLAP